MWLSPIGPEHRVKEFRSGSPRLDHYVRHVALREAARRHAATFVLSPADDAGKVLGYYTVMPLTFRLTSVEMSGALISHLAVDRRVRHRGHGRRLLRSALLRSVRGPSLSLSGVVVEAPEPALFAFYRKYGFRELVDHGGRLFHFPSAVRASAERVFGPYAEGG